MSNFPKLKVIRIFGYPPEEIREFEHAQYFLFSPAAPTIVMVEGQVIKSYEELVRLASQDPYKDMEFLEVKVSPPLVAGG